MTTAIDTTLMEQQSRSTLTPSEFVTENISMIPPSAGPVLDAGCGRGGHLAHLASHGYDAYGLGLSQDSLAEAQANLQAADLSAKLCQSPAWKIPFHGVSFAAVIAKGMLNHGVAGEIAGTVKEISNRLLPGGLLIATLLTPNDYRASGRHVAESSWICEQGPEQGTLHTMFDESAARDLLQEYFTIESIQLVSQTISLDSGQSVTEEVLQIRAAKK